MSDGAGIIEAIGEGVSKWQVGDKVMSLFFPNWHDGIPNLEKTSSISGETTDGFATEYSVQSEQSLTSSPRGYSYAQAATLPCAALTAWRGLVVEGNIKAGDSVLVEGTGGMSIFALQMAKAAFRMRALSGDGGFFRALRKSFCRLAWGEKPGQQHP